MNEMAFIRISITYPANTPINMSCPTAAEIAAFGENLRADTRTGGYRFSPDKSHAADLGIRLEGAKALPTEKLNLERAP